MTNIFSFSQNFLKESLIGASPSDAVYCHTQDTLFCLSWLIGWLYGMSTLVGLFNAEISLFGNYITSSN